MKNKNKFASGLPATCVPTQNKRRRKTGGAPVLVFGVFRRKPGWRLAFLRPICHDGWVFGGNFRHRKRQVRLHYNSNTRPRFQPAVAFVENSPIVNLFVSVHFVSSAHIVDAFHTFSLILLLLHSILIVLLIFKVYVIYLDQTFNHNHQTFRWYS